MRVDVDLNKCTGHGICESIADDIFEVQDDGSVRIHHDRLSEADREPVYQAVAQCPTGALRFAD